jgi:hypothetical protein
MSNISKLPVIFDYVKNNPKKTALEISEATGLNLLTVHRQLSGGYKKISVGTFVREKETRSLPPHKDGRIRGSFCYRYSVNENKNDGQNAAKKKVFVRDPITAALFGTGA